MRLAVLALSLAAALAGCTSINDLRAQEPAKVGEYPIAYRDLAACTSDELVGEFSVNSTVRDNPPMARVTYMAGYAETENAGWELTMRPAGSQTKVELRAHRTIWNTPYMGDEVWAAVERCGKKT
jgi:hypothetical protein